jgi:type III pantothenate kinase
LQGEIEPELVLDGLAKVHRERFYG